MPAIRSLATDEVARLTEEPRRYGFHATMKAPFRLDEKHSESDLLSALMHFSSSAAPVVIPRLKLHALGPFFALVPDEPVAALNQLANDVVVAFDRFRAPLSEVEIARRRPERLSEAQRHNVERWGYPYVFEEFRFHMTLTGPVEEKIALAWRERWTNFSRRFWTMQSRSPILPCSWNRSGRSIRNSLAASADGRQDDIGTDLTSGREALSDGE